METIRIYLDNMFARLPQTQQVLQLKENMLANMEDKYHELKQAGRSENEVIGIVISEFGNIDELLEEMNIPNNEETADTISLTQDQIDGYLKVKLENGIRIGIGVFLCILGAAMLILFDQLELDGLLPMPNSMRGSDVIGLAILLSFVAIGVALFIYSNMKIEPYQYISNGVSLTLEQRTSLEYTYPSSLQASHISTIIAITLFILSPISLFITSSMPKDRSDYGVVILLAMVAVGVCLLVITSSIKEGYETLLGIDDFASQK